MWYVISMFIGLLLGAGCMFLCVFSGTRSCGHAPKNQNADFEMQK